MECLHSKSAELGLLGEIRAKLGKYNDLAESEVTPLGRYATVQVCGDYRKREWLGATLDELVRPGCEDSDEKGIPLHAAGQVEDQFCQYYSDLYTSQIAYNEQGLMD
ncbi:hypothetical protein NDU88_004683 [Pleurodeles waltl]|uniref:Uncharacterized protein n=1 Tax=Pleurodeles waltl TaxID=8319 RepID=A0AAV7VJE7_PLEWA|nr:hypothetical protein NDU88_004683 [Pleurodeles waltl]